MQPGATEVLQYTRVYTAGWYNPEHRNNSRLYRLWCNDEKLLVTANAGIRIYNTSLTQLETYGNPIIAGIQQSAAYRDALMSGNGMLWAAHNTLAILCNKELNT